MKITLITGSFPNMPCGVGDYTRRLAEALLMEDSEVAVEVITSDDPRVAVLPNPRLSVRWVDRWGIMAIPYLLQALRSSRPDVVHIQYPTKGYGAGLAPNFLPLFLRLFWPEVRVVVTLHEFSIAHPLRKVSTVFFILCAHRLIVCDDREQRILNRLCHLRGRRVELVPLGANIPVCYQRTLRGNGGGELKLCYFGFWDKSKDGSLLLDVLARLQVEQLPVRLLFIGGIPPEKQAELRELAAEKGVGEAISFTGFCSPEDVSKCLANSDIGLFPFRDGVSLRRASFLAAMQHGLPVVTTRAGDYVPSGLVDGENVLLVPVADKEGFVQAVQRLALDAALRCKLSANARLWGAFFAWEVIARQHLNLYRQILNLGAKKGTGE